MDRRCMHYNDDDGGCMYAHLIIPLCHHTSILNKMTLWRQIQHQSAKFVSKPQPLTPPEQRMAAIFSGEGGGKVKKVISTFIPMMYLGGLQNIMDSVCDARQ